MKSKAERRADFAARLAELADRELPACGFCGRCVLAGVCCAAALAVHSTVSDGDEHD